MWVRTIAVSGRYEKNTRENTENNVGNTRHFSIIITVNPIAWRIKETKDT